MVYLVFYDYSWYPWLSTVISGYSWLSMVIHGYHWLSIVVFKCSVDKNIDTHENHNNR